MAAQQSSVKMASRDSRACFASAQAPASGAINPETSSDRAVTAPQSIVASGRSTATTAVKYTANSSDGTITA